MKTKDAFALNRLYNAFAQNEEEYPITFFLKGYSEQSISPLVDRIGSFEQSARWNKYGYRRVGFILKLIAKHCKRLNKFLKICDMFAPNWLRATDLLSHYQRLKELIRPAKNFFQFTNDDQALYRRAFTEELGNRMRLARRRKGITQEETASFLGIKKAAYSHYEIGRREIPPLFLYQLAKIFEVSTDWLLGIEKTP